MLSEDESKRMRRAYYIDHLKVSQITRETGHCRRTVLKRRISLLSPSFGIDKRHPLCLVPLD